MKFSTDILAAALSGMKAKLDGGRMYYFAGPVPASAEDALDMVNRHTRLVEFTVGGAGGGLTFGQPNGGFLPKAEGEAWVGKVAFVGANAAATTLTPTFYRFCAAGDDGSGAATTPRVQGTIGGPSSSADIKLSDGATVTANGANTRSLSIWGINLTSV